MQALRPSEVCPQPFSVSSRLLGSIRAAACAPAYGVAGSCRLPITSTGSEVRWVKGPVYRAASLAGQVAHGSLAQVQSEPKYGLCSSCSAAAQSGDELGGRGRAGGGVGVQRLQQLRKVGEVGGTEVVQGAEGDVDDVREG